MNAELKEAILQQCRKKIVPLELFNEEEEMEDIEEKKSEVMELPFEDILAEKRRRYNHKEEFIFLLYNDLLKYFVKEWDGTYLRKKPRRKVDADSKEVSSDDENVDKSLEDLNVLKEDYYDFEENANGTSKLDCSCSWKLTLPDEFANITFITNNTYSGRISRKMMEGEGVYRWSNGAQYKGEFEKNYMHGKGLLEWNSVCWYEGDFANGYPHGRGIMVDGEHHYMYTGQWHKGQRHGKGYSRYEDNGSYDGDWTMDKMNGTGLRIYPSGARYVGQWRNGVRHGFGTMVWANGDVYRGEWKCGAMEGYGIYVWNGFFNKTFTWPQEVSYVGYWHHAMRHGKGDMKWNSVGGAKYSGYWKNNKKHGYGIMIGNNGKKLESDSLFLDNVFCASDIINNTIKIETEKKYEQKCVCADEEKTPQFIEKPEQLTETLVSPILKPEQFPCLSYHITRLLDPKSLEPPLVISISSGKCYSCENKSCSCLAPHPSIDTSEENDLTWRNVSESHIENIESNWNYEEHWTYNCLMLHMFRLRRIYNDYAKLFTKSPPNCNLVMTRLCLWQLWRDCNIHEKGLSLAEIDIHIGKY
ncbi:unnamed protein product [Xylocopa violacea]|uniref:Uncharacterized protein n=1 Tax=Xylocopa violacea TaxID=135666 RepID=A0ABP1MYK0_XYLVO